MAVFAYETWSGLKRLVTADKVVFKPGHVVWLTVDDQLVLAERNPNVNHLTQLPDEPEAPS
jgi:hypothetical protein